MKYLQQHHFKSRCCVPFLKKTAVCISREKQRSESSGQFGLMKLRRIAVGAAPHVLGKDEGLQINIGEVVVPPLVYRAVQVVQMAISKLMQIGYSPFRSSRNVWAYIMATGLQMQ